MPERKNRTYESDFAILTALSRSQEKDSPLAGSGRTNKPGRSKELTQEEKTIVVNRLIDYFQNQ